ncbi:MAG TPA: hypothetical protein VFV19_17215 [Candidatus Polarisedimenticolaceae bacterium]|nr:hypothetical protein [Candidatus Polarisedimenticolaceae bacterium]
MGSAAFLFTALIVTTGAQAADTCVQTRVTDAFVSPDGHVHGPGVVKVCPYWSVTPSLRLNSVSFNGTTLGIWMTRAGEAGKFADGTMIALRRLPEGRIALADYYWPGRDGRPEAPGLRAASSAAASAGP